MNTLLIDKLHTKYPNLSIEGNKSGTMAVVVTNTERLYYALDVNNEPFLNFARPINNLSNTAIMKMDKHLTDKELAQKAYCLLDITSAGLFGAYGWNIKGRSITSKTAPGCRYTRIWYLNGVRIQYRYIQLLTYKLLGLI